MTRIPEDVTFLYLAEADLYRLGNSTSPRLDHVRESGRKDVDTYERNGIRMVKANGKGISLLTESRLATFTGGWLWKLPKGTAMPSGLILNHDQADHYSLCPKSDMTMDGYRALLSGLAIRCERIRKV